MSKVVEVTDRTFEEEVLESDLPTEVDFWAPWCAPCLRVAPIYDELSREYDGFTFCKINVDDNVETARTYHVMSIPMQLFFVNGEKVDELLGAVPEQLIRSKVAEVMQRFPTDERGRLRVILASWVEHNRQASQKFRRLTRKVEEMRSEAVYNSVLRAASQMEEANERLSDLLSEL